jgi:hypothetical protein
MRLLSRIFSRRRRYDDISVSIEEHIEERIDELMADGSLVVISVAPARTGGLKCRPAEARVSKRR